MDSEKIGTFIKKLRTDNNMRQIDLAEKIPINREAISKWECGRTIPDSSTILRLSEIFGVSADEIMYGEYKTTDNKSKLEQVHLQIYDDRNKLNKKLNKILKVLFVSLILTLFIVTIFLFYYFFNSYDSVKIYTVESNQDDVYLTDGIIMLTGDSIYFRLGNINGIDENQITKVILYYKKNDNKKIIYESTSSKDGLIRDYYDYNEYFEIKNKDVVFDSLFVDIYYDNKMDTIKLTMKEDYSNKKLFFQKKKQGKLQKSQEEIVENNNLIDRIKKNFKTEDNEIYSKKIKINNISYDLQYIDSSHSLLILWEKDNYLHSIFYNCIYESANYEKTKNKEKESVKCYYKKNDDTKNTCDNSIKEILNFIINDILNERS